jgi:hypothetical protein
MAGRTTHCRPHDRVGECDATARAHPGVVGPCGITNMAHTTFPMSLGVVEVVYPHLSLSEPTTSRPRPVSARRLGFFGAGGLELGSATTQSTRGPDSSRPTRTGQLARFWFNAGIAWRNALVSNSDTTVVMSSQRCVTPHRRKAAMENSRPTRTAPASMASVWLVASGKHVWPSPPESADGDQSPLVIPAISAAAFSHWKPAVPLPSGWRITLSEAAGVRPLSPANESALGTTT